MNWNRWVLCAALCVSFAACGDNEEIAPPSCEVEPEQAHCEVEPPVDTPDPPPDEVTEIPETCNGSVELCDRTFDQVAFAGTHNSMSVAAEGWSIPNQNLSMRMQLQSGIRVFLFDVHTDALESVPAGQKPVLYLCHTLCFIGKRPLADGLIDFRDFLLTERGEVLTFIIQDEVPVDDLFEALEAAGLERWAYVYEGGEWPTMRELIDTNKRLIVSVERGQPTQAWGRKVWDIAFDNPYTYTELDEMDCRANRGSTSNSLFLMNHWLGPVSDPKLSEVANTFEALMTHAETCRDRHGRWPNFIAVDHYDLGDLMEVVDEVNARIGGELAL